MKRAKQRDSNFEVLRILSMCGIIAVHYMNNEIGGAVQNAVFPNFSWLFSHFLSSFCVPLINCFVLISGYFLISKRTFHPLRKSVDLLLITAFYGIIAYGISVITGNNAFKFSELAYAIVPFLRGKRWFVETYIILILFAPFLNKMLNSLGRKPYNVLLTVQIMIFSVWYSLGFSAPLLDDGYGIINFITLYMIGGYLKLYGKNMKLYQQKGWKLLVGFLGTSILTFLLSYFTNPYGYAFVTNILGAAILFVFFMKWDIGEIRLVNEISSAAFDVYCVHSDKNTSLLLIYELLGAKFVADTPLIAAHILFVVVVVWLVGFCACQIRKWIFGVTVNRWLDKSQFINRELEI